jgi:ABC-type multidrug transport system fused ATPase/permease subunit
MNNEDTDDLDREIRINRKQANYIKNSVADSFREELDPYVSNSTLSQTFNALTWPLSVTGLQFKAGDVAKRLTERMTFFMDKQVLTGENLTLSGGERQKLMIAMVLLHKPDILILDEITAALDRDTGEKLYKEMLEQIPEKTTVISIAHNEHIMKYHTIHAHLSGKTITLTPLKKEGQPKAPAPKSP